VIGAWTNAMRGEVFAALYVPKGGDRSTTDPWEPLDTPRVAPPADAAAHWRALAVATGWWWRGT